MKKIFSFDAETNGLWGQAFAIGAVITDTKGNILDKFIGRCPIDEIVNPWVADNVLPQMENVATTHSSYKELLKDFMSFYMKNKTDAHIIVHMGLPVEARLFLDAYNLGIIGNWDAPYPLIDICAFPQISDSVDNYNLKNGLVVDKNIFEGGTHNPLYDSLATAVAYANIISEGGFENV